MKNNRLLMFATFAVASSFSVISCGPKETPDTSKFYFIPYMEISNKRITRPLVVGEAGQIKVDEVNRKEGQEVFYTYELADTADSQYLTVDFDGSFEAIKKTPENYTVLVTVLEENSFEDRTLQITIEDETELADGGYNFSSSSKDRTDALGELEGFAMKNFLTGISLFENGGYVKYSDRFNFGSNTWIKGYGYGLLSEGSPNPDASWDLRSQDNYQSYYHSGSSSSPTHLNAWMATGSEISSLNSYITSSFYGTRIYTGTDPEKANTYEWYPILAKDNCPEPIPMRYNESTHQYEKVTDGTEKTGSFKRWRIYVKTDDEFFAETGKHLQYHRGGDYDDDEDAVYGGVTLEDYEFTFKMLLTGGTRLTRGSELAGDTSYGFKGAYNYNKLTYNYNTGTAQEYLDIEDAWETFKAGGGFNTGKDAGGSYLEFEFINPLDRFNAKYNLSSNLYSPLPETFVSGLATNGWIGGAQKYAQITGKVDSDKDICKHLLCLGPYRLREWVSKQSIVFTRCADWFEYSPVEGEGRYKIPGVYIRVFDGATSNQLYNNFAESHLIDSAGVPMGVSKEGAKKSEGDSTFKLNVNSCDQDRWDELFGPGGQEYKDGDKSWSVNPFMSNKNFLKGLFWSIDRRTFGDDRGATGSYNYFADSYLSDPNGESYNGTTAHKKAVKDFLGVDPDDTSIDEDIRLYGYDVNRAIGYFQAAVGQLLNEQKITMGPNASDPSVYHLRMEWMNVTDRNEYHTYIAKYFEDAFNNPAVSGGKIKLVCDFHATPNDWEAVYNKYLMKGQYDLGFGAISGNTLNPLNFMEVLKSDNSTKFTLNWGADTAKLDSNNPIKFKDKEWSFDSLWAAADHGAVTAKGLPEKIVQNGYVKEYSDLEGQPSDSFQFGEKVTLTFEFLGFDNPEQAGVTFSIDRLQLYMVGAGIEELVEGVDYELDLENDKIELTFSIERAQQINNYIFTRNQGLQDQYKDLSKDELDDFEEIDDFRAKVRSGEWTKAQYEAKIGEYQATEAGRAKLANFNKVRNIKEKFTMDNYYLEDRTDWFWAIEVYYDVKIGTSDATQSSHTILKDASSKKNSAYSFAK